MTSGGARARSGPGADPDSYRSQNRDWIDLPAAGYVGDVPDFPLSRISVYYTEYENGKPSRVFDAEGTDQKRDDELALWSELWTKPQAHAWAALGLKYQVAAYVRGFIEATSADSNAGLKTAAIRMEAELGISIMGMKQNLWRVSDGSAAPIAAPAAARKTSSGDWLKAVSVEGA